ncbi:MAG: T9SS type A sorting domain-containing protein [Bacteroidia bacterium]|nr:T9SS type A sorting domain-containing protein [Bacteroidia bacterium]
MKTKQLLIRFSLILNFLLCCLYCAAQPSIQWQKCMGGTGMDAPMSTIATSDGGYIMTGAANSLNGDVTGVHGTFLDIWIVKTDANGNLQWQKTYGGTAYELSTSIIQTSDGGYIIAGETNSTDGDVTGNHGNYDAWIVKIDVNGNLQWQKCLGGSNGDLGQSILQTTDGGYIVGGTTGSTDGDVTGLHGTSQDVWMVKLDAAGNISWQKCLGGTGTDGIFGVSLQGLNFRQVTIDTTYDGGYIIATNSASNDGDVSGHHTGGSTPDFDTWIVKTDSLGAIQWQKSLGGTGVEMTYSVLHTSDGGYIVSAQTNSTDGDVTGNHGNYDAWVIKLDSVGAIQWQKCYGGTSADRACSISKTNDGGYFITGFASSHDGDVAGAHGNFEVWTIKIDAAGVLQWQKTLGGTLKDVSSAGFQTADGGFIVSGNTNSNDFDVSGHHGTGTNNYDFWLVKLSPVPINVITGNIYEDLDLDCIKDTNELNLYGKMVKAMPGNYYAVTDSNGNYTLFVDSGLYTISHIPSQYYNQSCPAATGTYTANINWLTPNSYGNDFADTLTSHCADLTISIGTFYLRRCFKNSYTVHYTNNGAVTANNVFINVNFDNLIIPLSSNLPWSLAGNTYTFNIGTVLPGQSGNFYVLDSVDCNATGQQNECAFATITTTDAECDTTNNSDHDCHIIVGSCDPNAKEVASQDFLNNGYAKQENCDTSDALTYMIRFQNTGTDTAFTVVIRDTLASYLDVATVQPGASSHLYTFRIYGQGILEWTFNNILLPDSIANEVGSHGFVKFSVQQTAGNNPGTVINNSANIIFDYNAPVLTDTAVVIINSLTTSVMDLVNDQLLVVYPNPTNNYINIKSETSIGTLTIYNSTGQIISREKVAGTQHLVDLSAQPAGIYFLQIQSKHIKIIKQ